MKSTLKYILFVFIAFMFYGFIGTQYFRSIKNAFNSFIGVKSIDLLLTYIVTVIPIILTSFLLFKKNTLESLGLTKSLFYGILIANIFALPMLFGYTIMYNFNTAISFKTILSKAIYPAFFEELVFRGFLFGYLFRFTKLGFIPTILVGSLFFGIGHLHQSTDLLTLIGVFVATAIGAIIFGWLYVEWKFNLWVAIGLHLFMNLFWELFKVDATAAGSLSANIFRFLVIVFAIVGTILYKKRKNELFEVNKNSLFWKK